MKESWRCADLFDTSVDVLLGYEAKNNKRSALITRLKGFKEHLNETERYLTETIDFSLYMI